MIDVRNLSKVYRVHQKEPGLKGSIQSLFRRQWLDKHALKDVSLKIAAGEIVGLAGANGAGKTTLVKILAGIIYPTFNENHEDVRVLGHRPWERKNDFRRQIALIMGQKAQLWWDLPAADCYLLLREIYQIPPKQFKQNLDYLVTALVVQDQMKIQLRRLSLGERMKMELIAALLHQPKVVFLDEPTIGLDLTAQRAIRDFLLKYRHEHQPAMILTSHYMEDIERLCERIVIIREGQFVYDGALARISADYGRHKVINVRLDVSQGPQPGATSFSYEQGEVIHADDHQIRIKVPRDRVPEAANALLKSFAVNDLSIEEEEIGTLIEALQSRGSV